MRRCFVLSILFVHMLTSLRAQSVPSPEAYLGYPLGSRFSPHHKITGYVETLAKARPDRMKVQSYGKTYEGRPLMVAILSSPENIGRLENIRLNNLRLARQSGDQAPGNPDAPAIVWMSYNVHGNEASSSEAVMKTLYTLLDPSNAKAQEWLKNTVVIIDPCINPDGRDRYASWYHSVAASTPDPQPSAREHAEPWPGGRTNHYNFDLNRDWAWQSQVETQQRLKLYNQWLPQIHVDFHEQGYNEPYYFAPAAEPMHEVITPWQRSFQTAIGKNHAKYFDANGWLYFTKERFDLFYPSYGDTYPTYNGAIGMTYEQGGIRAGLAIINEDGDTLTLKDRLEHHHTTGLSTIEIASQNAGKLVTEFKKFFDDAVSQGSGTYKTFLIRNDVNRPDVLSGLKQFFSKNGIRFQYALAAKPFRALNYHTGKEETISAAAGDLLISTHQPRGAYARVLLEPRSVLTDSATYDITAWSIPYAWGVEAFATTEKLEGLEIEPPKLVQTTKVTTNPIGYIVPWNAFNSARLLSVLLQKEVKVRVSDVPFKVDGVTFERGSLIILKTSNHRFGDQLAAVIRQSTESVGLKASITPVTTGFAESGPDFGSPLVRSLKAPRVAMLTGENVSALAAGTIWHYFEQELGYPLTLIDVSTASRMRWNEVDVLILPDGNYRFLNDKSAQEQLKNWMMQGGRLIALEDAAMQLARFDWGFTVRKAEEDKDKDIYAKLKRYGDAERDDLKSSIPGAIYKVELDNTHPLAFGFPRYFFTLKRDDSLLEYQEGGWNVGVLKKDNYITGFAGMKAKTNMKDGLVLGSKRIGNGQLVMMATDPIFRSFWENGKLLLANAVFMVD